MHLSDTELLEPSEKNQSHLSTCPICQARYKQLSNVREQLSHIEPPEFDTLDASWQIIEHSIEQASKPMPTVKRPWFITSMAASFVAIGLFAGLLWQGISEDAKLDSKIAQLVSQSHILEAQLYNQNPRDASQMMHLASTRYQISLIDQTIQNAYIAQLSKQEIMQLWQEKIKLLQQYAAKPASKTSIKV